MKIFFFLLICYTITYNGKKREKKIVIKKFNFRILNARLYKVLRERNNMMVLHMHIQFAILFLVSQKANTDIFNFGLKYLRTEYNSLD